MALFTVSTPFNIDLEFSLAAFYKRMFAWLMDLLLILIYCYVMIFFVYGNILGDNKLSFDGQDKLGFLLGLFTIAIPVMLYHLLFEIFMNGRSPGKFFMGIKVMNKEGASATLSQLLLRWILCLPNYFLVMVIGIVSPVYFFGIVMILGIAALPDIISMAISAKSQRLGDLAAGTVVVDTRYKMDLSETIYRTVEDENYQPLYPEVLQLSDRDINSIRNLLSKKMDHDTENYMYRIAYKVEQALAIKMDGAPHAFLQRLLMDYNYLTRQKNT